MKIIHVTSTLNNKNNKVQNNFSAISFGTFMQPESKLFSRITKQKSEFDNKDTDIIARPIVSILNTKVFQGLVEKTKKCKNLVQHLTALTSFVLSGFYIQRTLTNDKLDEQKRKTLAINEGAVAVLSTALSYTVCKALEKKIDKFSNKFLMLNSKNLLGAEGLKKLETYQEGIRSAASIMIFMTIARFISPVVVTPITNMIGNMLHEKKQAAMNGGKK